MGKVILLLKRKRRESYDHLAEVNLQPMGGGKLQEWAFELKLWVGIPSDYDYYRIGT